MTEDQVKKSWTGMIYRCFYPSCPWWNRYGGRGITVCDRWSHPDTGFDAFLADMGCSDSAESVSIDRIDPDGDYEPGNCRWATAIQQARNRSSITKRKLWSHIIDKFLCLRPMRYDAYLDSVKRRRSEPGWSYWKQRDFAFHVAGKFEVDHPQCWKTGLMPSRRKNKETTL